MKIERNNVKLEVNKPEVRFDEDLFTQAEEKKAKKVKALLIATAVVAGIAGMLSTIRKMQKRIEEYKKD